MKRPFFASLALASLFIGANAHANPAVEISKLETKLDRLSGYFEANCDEDALTPQCKRVEKSILRIGKEIEQAKQAVSVSLRTTANVTADGREPSLIDRQFDILQARMRKIEKFMERLEGSDDPQKDAKLKALQTQLDLVRSRLLQLQATKSDG